MKQYVRKEVIEAITLEDLNQLIIDSKAVIEDGKPFYLNNLNFFFVRQNENFAIEVEGGMTYVLNKKNVLFFKYFENELVKCDIVDIDVFNKFYKLKN